MITLELTEIWRITDDYDYDDFENLSHICGVYDFAFDNVLSILFCISEEVARK